MSKESTYRQFARMIGVDEKSVRKRIASGAITAVSRKENGRPFITDVDLAREQWETSAGQITKTSRNAATAEDAVIPADGTLVSADTLNEAQRLATIERARKLRISNQKERGVLIEVKHATREAFEASRIIRESMLNLPPRLSAELAAETDAGRVYSILDAAIREALASTADALMAVNG